MDDADTGLRGARAEPGPGLLRAVRGRYGLDRVTEGIDLGGSSSLNLLVGDAERRYVVRVHRPRVGPELEASLRIMTDLDRWRDAFA
jgi:Ser/Thr protein kinase RdoA (MazF antagonist)